MGRPPESEKILFLGSKPLALKCLRAVRTALPDAQLGVLTIDDRADGRTAWTGIHEYCSDTGIPVTVVSSRKESEEVVAREAPALCLVVGWYWLVSKATLALPKHGFLGIHFSLLPRYRGMSPLVWALINGERRVGTSLFSFAEGVDTGPVWGQRAVDVGPDEYIGELLPKLEDASLNLLSETLPQVLAGSRRARPQDDSEASYCARREPADGEIDWSWSAKRIVNFVRAQSRPYPGAFGRLAGEKVVIWRASSFRRPFFGAPGQIVSVGGGLKGVACGDESAIVLENVERGSTSGTPAKVSLPLNARFDSFIQGGEKTPA